MAALSLEAPANRLLDLNGRMHGRARRKDPDPVHQGNRCRPKKAVEKREVVTELDSGAVAVVVFTKLDLGDDPSPHLAAAADGAPGVLCHLVSGATSEGVDAVLEHLAGARTGVLIGPSGAGKSTLIDTPGLRAFGPSGGGEGLAEAFADVEELAARCRFRDCRHEDEPGCAVLAAVASLRYDRDPRRACDGASVGVDQMGLP